MAPHLFILYKVPLLPCDRDDLRELQAQHKCTMPYDKASKNSDDKKL